MEALKKQRKALRTVFTKALNAFLADLTKDITNEEKLISFQFLEAKMAELDATHDAHNKELFASEITDAELTKELDSNDGYKKQFFSARMKMTEKMTGVSQVPESGPTMVRRTMKLPAIELPRFSGNIKEWLPFWSQFRKIDNDGTISKEDKFQYLLQATIPGSRANDVVSSFPPTSENYEKVIKSLKNRFGREEIVVEYYVRELLGLVLQNAVRGEKETSLSSLYDRVESNIRALETLGVTTDKCAAMLYPLVESSLPEEILRAWQRSGQKCVKESAEQAETKDRLTRLLEFLLLEVENEERIEMALTGFGTSSEQDRTRKQRGKVEPVKEVASASVLLTSKITEKTVSCIFCKSQHESKDCDAARKLGLEERRDIVRRENACFVCLRRGHISMKFRIKVNCDWCSRHHVLIMCPNFASRSPESKPNESEKTVYENNLTTFCEVTTVYLQTLKVKLYSQSQEKIVRVLIDNASHRSYIRTQIAKELEYTALGKQEVIHSLFGGIKSERSSHSKFLARIKNLDNSYACNFKVMNEDVICDTIPCIKDAPWIKELRDKNIILTDIEEGNRPIDILIGADVAGKLLTGRKYNLQNGIVAIETTLGWTVMGELPNENVRNDTAVMITTLYVQEASLSDLWRLDVIGISDPIEKLDESLENQKTLRFLTETTKLTTDGRYEVRLPFKNNHSTVSSNYEISRCRLLKVIEKLKTDNMLSMYEDVFEEWLSEGVIEKVTGKEIENFCHYLPHRPVIKLHSTTKVRPVFDASACKKGYPSLNQCLEKGPNLIDLIPSSLNRFREKEIGVVSDIANKCQQTRSGLPSFFMAKGRENSNFSTLSRGVWIVMQSIFISGNYKFTFDDSNRKSKGGKRL